MEPIKYEKLGKKFTEIEFKPGVAVTLKQKKAECVLSVDEKIENPALSAEFKVKKAGKAIVGFAEGKPQISIIPKLDKIKTELTINPLENTFVFSTKKKIKKMKTKAIFGFDSAKLAPSLLLMPKFKVNKMKVHAGILLKKPEEGLPPVLFDAQAKIKKVNFVACFDEESKEYQAGVFAKIAKKLHAGALFHFQPTQENLLASIDLYSKLKYKGHKAGLIVSSLQTGKFNAQGKLGKKVKYGLNVNYDKDINGSFGIKADLKKMDLNLVLKATKEAEKEITPGLLGEAKFKIKKLGKAKVGLSIPNLSDAKEINYFVNLKIKD